MRSLIASRLGIVLATLNVCYFVSRDCVHYVFEHIHGEKYIFEDIILEKCFFSGDINLVLTGMKLAEGMALINLPALLLSLLSSKLINISISGVCFFTGAKFEIAFILFFITFQWLFIGWIAKTVARKIQALRS